MDPHEAQSQDRHAPLRRRKPRGPIGFNTRESRVRKLLEQAQAHASENEWEKSLLACNLAIREAPDNAEAHNERAYALYELDRYEEALESCDRALVLNPDLDLTESIYRTRAVSLDCLDREEEAIQAGVAGDRARDMRIAAYDFAIKAGTTMDVETHLDIGDALFACTSRDAEALAVYDRALSASTEQPEKAPLCHFRRAAALQRLGHYELALQDADRAAALWPTWARAHNLRGNILRAMERHHDALAAYNQVLTIHSISRDEEILSKHARLRRGDIYDAMGMTDKASHEYQLYMAAVTAPEFDLEVERVRQWLLQHR